MHDYRDGDVYHALARMCGLTDDPDPIRWKQQNPAMRDRMKPLQLAIGYGMGVPSLAKGLNRHPLIASAIIERHKQTYPPGSGARRKCSAPCSSAGSKRSSAGRSI
jgi:hypothetical protein